MHDLRRAQHRLHPSIDLNLHRSNTTLISRKPSITNLVPRTRRQPLEAKLKNTSLLTRVEHQVQALTIVAISLRNEHVRELDIREQRSLHGSRIRSVEGSIGQMLMPHQTRHQGHDLRGSGEALVAQSAQLGGFDGEELVIELLQRVLADLIIAELSSAASDEGARELIPPL